MSGRKQHFIPQSLLKGFGVRKGRSTQVIVYTPERGIFTVATDGVAAERDFYSGPVLNGLGETLDDRITSHEASLATTIAAMRDLGRNDPVDAAAAAALVSHLAVRNDSFRRVVTSATSAMVEGVSDAFEDEDRARALLGLAGEEPAGVFAEQLAEAYARLRPALAALGVDMARFKAWAFTKAKAEFGTYHEQSRADRAAFASLVLERTPAMVADAQRGGLMRELVPAERVDRLAAFDWRVLSADCTLVLPDCVAAGMDDQKRLRPLMLVELARLRAVVLPLAANRLLVGSDGGDLAMPSDFNGEAAACSWDFFVAPRRTEELAALRPQMRTRASGFVDETVGSAVTEAVDKRLRDL